jgi:AbiV family abortive infection protein
MLPSARRLPASTDVISRRYSPAMRPRQLPEIGKKRPAERPALIAEGCAALALHMGELHAAALALRTTGLSVPANILDGYALEEAAKALILVDLIRAGADQKLVKRCIKAFYNHRARWGYARLISMSPANWREAAERFTESTESAFDLDGWEGAEFLVRNEFDLARETMLYVDYVTSGDNDEHAEWSAPQTRSYLAGMVALDSVESVRLVQAMSAIGLFTETGLRAVADVWAKVDRAELPIPVPPIQILGRDHVVNPTLHWQDLRQLTYDVFMRVPAEDGTTADVRHVMENWTFPVAWIGAPQSSAPDVERQRSEAIARRDEGTNWWR